MADLAWTIVTILLVIACLVVVAVGFPGAIGRGVRARLRRGQPAKPDERAPPQRMHDA